MDDRWQTFFEKFPETVTCEQLPVKLPRFDLDLSDLAGAAADWCQQYLKDRYYVILQHSFGVIGYLLISSFNNCSLIKFFNII